MIELPPWADRLPDHRQGLVRPALREVKVMNAFLDLADRQLTAPAKRRLHSAAERARNKALAERDKLFRFWLEHCRKQREELLAGPYGEAAHELIALLDRMTLEQGGELIALVERGPWRSADAIRASPVLQLVDGSIARLRERHGLAPFDDTCRGPTSARPSFRSSGRCWHDQGHSRRHMPPPSAGSSRAREHTVGASDIGQCARRKCFWTKMEGDADLRRRARRQLRRQLGRATPRLDVRERSSGCRRCAARSAATCSMPAPSSRPWFPGCLSSDAGRSPDQAAARRS